MPVYKELGKLVGFHCQIPEDDWKFLCRLADKRSGAERRRVSMAELVREAITVYRTQITIA